MRRVRTFAALTACLAALAACGPAQAPTPPEQPGGEAAPAPAAVLDPAIAAKIAALPAPYNQADYENGRKIFNQCRACHLTEAGAGHRVGPNLHGVFGRKAGAAANFAYSDAVKNSGIVWDAEKLDHWLEQPRAFLPGNRMTFMGVRDPKDRRDVIAYLDVESSK
ncbi:MAG: cytochrome c family protein [Hyphomonadaceae bacterium]